ncbi:sugar phosphate isomerase/epimerase family protein [Humisphaera borealis]|uniref:Sugar phosphate isomerase/epimerase n=1 Tax=Humisphaera borealis TaxID=2807512 RepID=A0A7M2X120_9BACT|nr:TIM barrel protein [Humisphaera borealis]QOV91438.1 sugar phosphate isomerase/epimerase [Humisphaera borealis]
MTLGFSTYGMKTLTAIEAVKAVAKIGFDAVELCCLPDFHGDPASLSPAARKDLASTIGDSGLRLVALMENLPLHVDDKTFAANLERLKRVCELSAQLSPQSPPIVETVMGGAAGKLDDLMDSFARRLSDYASIAKQAGVPMAVKPHRMNAVDSPARMIRLLNHAAQPRYLSMVYDWSHYAQRDDLKDADGKPVTIEGTVKESLPYTSFVAVKDVVFEKGKAVFKLPGETGQTDNATVVKTLHAGGYTGDVNCEVSSQIWKAPGYDAIAAATASYKAMSAAFEKAGVPRNKR